MLSSPEQCLARRLILSLREQLTQILPAVPQEEDYFWHMATSCFEHASKLLWTLGLAYGADAETRERPYVEGTWFPYFRFLEESEMSDKLEGMPAFDPHQLTQIFEIYLSIACQYGKSCLPCCSTAFDPPLRFEADVVALLESGRLEKRGTRVVWSQNMAHIFSSVE